MAVTYPITLPSAPGFRRVSIQPRSSVAAYASPFTQQQQVYAHPGQLWTGEFELPPMSRAEAAPWIAALTSLNGIEGTFYFGDPAWTLPRGSGLTIPLISASPAILNGGFETAGGGGGDVFADWIESTSGASTVNRDTTDFHSGTASCRLDVDGSNSIVGISRAALVTIGKNYRLRFWAKASANTTSALRLSNQLPGPDSVFYDLTTSWQLFETTFTAQDAGFILVRDIAPGISIWIDDVELQPLDVYSGLVNGANQTGQDLITDGWTISATPLFKAGDWVQVGTGATRQLCMVLADVNSNSSGQATLSLFPRIRTAFADNTVILASSPAGLWRLTANAAWTIGVDSLVAGLSVQFVEAL